MTRILACIDGSAYATSVCDLTAWAAPRLDASVEILQVVQRSDAVAARHDLSGAIGLGVKSELLEELTRIDQEQGRLAIERGRVLLAAAEQRLTEAGVREVTPLHRHGDIVETIVEREADADLVVVGKRGVSSAGDTEHIGALIEQVVRASVKPVLIASSRITTPRVAVVAFDGSAAATRALDVVATSPLFAGLDVHVIVAGADDTTHRRCLDTAVIRLSERRPEGGAAPVATLLSGAADKALSGYMTDQPDALLVMGAYGHSPLRSFFLGSTTTSTIRTVHSPVLLVR
ncbi:universal stress protein [Roseospira marina]|uniref:Universal stress protein n=1 Tax=Roseospira marina TaxID=140057 RepID=A0A5M6IDQ6_9PROT|nr:universal stress protein [Roseospira marina]KAA5606420.1 universal stress protein [Roseospira marina]MBB4314166.1 nucleotide-binding universal stress UspA family protein [Roseospira marina]MBB5087327.1 nucleotide-binding universal stress UspA family protein [Roseospira marina]